MVEDLEAHPHLEAQHLEEPLNLDLGLHLEDSLHLGVEPHLVQPLLLEVQQGAALLGQLVLLALEVLQGG